MAYNYVNRTGVIVPDTSDIQSDVQDEYRSALGTDLDVSPQTPQGRLIAGETTSRTAVAVNNATLANQIKPK